MLLNFLKVFFLSKQVLENTWKSSVDLDKPHRYISLKIDAEFSPSRESIKSTDKDGSVDGYRQTFVKDHASFIQRQMDIATRMYRHQT